MCRTMKAIWVISYYLALVPFLWLAQTLVEHLGTPQRGYAFLILTVIVCALLPFRNNFHCLGEKCRGGFVGVLAGFFIFSVLDITLIRPVSDVSSVAVQSTACMMAIYLGLTGAALGLFAARWFLVGRREAHYLGFWRRPRTHVVIDLVVIALAATGIIFYTPSDARSPQQGGNVRPPATETEPQMPQNIEME